MSALSNIVSFPGAGPASPAPDAPPASSGSAALVSVAEAIDEPAILSLYSTQDQLEALSNTLDLVPPEQEDELVNLISQTLSAYTDKRDRVNRFVAHVENQVEFADAEIKRLKRRKELFEKFLERIEGWIERALFKLGRDPKDKAKRRWLKLEGATSTLGLKNLPDTVEIEDEAQIPSRYKKTTVTMPATLWEQILDTVPLEIGSQLLDVKRSDEALKTPIKEALAAQQIVPGARLATDRVKLVRA